MVSGLWPPAPTFLFAGHQPQPQAAPTAVGAAFRLTYRCCALIIHLMPVLCLLCVSNFTKPHIYKVITHSMCRLWLNNTLYTTSLMLHKSNCSIRVPGAPGMVEVRLASCLFFCSRNSQLVLHLMCSEMLVDSSQQEAIGSDTQLLGSLDCQNARNTVWIFLCQWP